MYSSILSGGINMVNIKNVLHVMRTKWMVCLCKDCSLSWSRIIWNKLQHSIPESLLSGLTAVTKQDITQLPLFYCAMIHSYAYVNSIFYQHNPKLQLQWNLFGTSFAPRVKWTWVCTGYLTLSDLPLSQGKLDFAQIAAHVSSSADLYLF